MTATIASDVNTGNRNTVIATHQWSITISFQAWRGMENIQPLRQDTGVVSINLLAMFCKSAWIG